MEFEDGRETDKLNRERKVKRVQRDSLLSRLTPGSTSAGLSVDAMIQADSGGARGGAMGGARGGAKGGAGSAGREGGEGGGPWAESFEL